MPEKCYFTLDELRQKADTLADAGHKGVEVFSPEEIRRIVHDLRWHETQLETQNKKLRAVHKETEAARDKYMRLYRYAPACYVTVDRAGIVKDVNRSFCEFAHAAPEEILGTPFSALLCQESRTMFIERLSDFFDTPGHAAAMELQVKVNTETCRYIRVNGHTDNSRVINGGKDSSPCLLLVIQDIDREKRSRKELAFQAQLLNAVGQSVIATDPAGTILYWNTSAEQLYGWRADEVLGRNIIEITPAETTREQAAGIMDALSKGEKWSGEFLTRRRDGTSFPAHVTDTPVMDDTGKLAAIIGISYDLAQWKEAQQQMLSEKKRTEDVLESIGHGFFALDNEMRITYFNKRAEELLGCSREDVLGKGMFTEAFPEAAGSIFDNQYTEALKNQEQVSFEAYFKEKPYENWYQVNVYPYEGGISVYFDVITERKKAEERIKHLNAVLRAIRNVNQLITHEKNPRKLIQQACKELTETRGYYNAWIVLLDQNQNYVDSASRGLGRHFRRLRSQMKKQVFTRCGQMALETSELIWVRNPEKECGDCALSGFYEGRSGFTIQLRHEQRVYGLLTVSIPPEYIEDREEQELFKEVAGDIGFALHSIEQDQKKQQAEEKLRWANMVVENSSVVAFRWKAEPGWPVAFVTENCQRLLGYTAHQLTSGTITYESLIHPHDLEQVKAEVGNHSESGAGIFRQQYRLVSRTGEPVWVADRTTLIRDDSGAVQYYQGLVYDITERMQAEAVLREREAFLQKILETANDGFWVVDSEGYIEEANQAALDMAGYTHEELTGLHIKDIDAADGTKDIAERIERIIRNGSGVFQTIHKKKNGEFFDAEISASWIDSTGGKFVCFIRDITESKKASQKLLESEKRFRDVLENVQLIAVQLDSKGNITFVNDFFLGLTGWEREDVLGRDWFDMFIPEKDKEAIRKDVFLKTVQDVEGPPKFENEIITKSGQLRHIRWSNTYVYNLNGDVTGATSIGQDITEQRMAQNAIIAEKERAQQYLDIAGVMFVAIDTQGCVIMANKRAAHVLEYPEEEITGKNWFDHFVLSDNCDEVKKTFSEIIAGHIKPFEYVENHVKTRTGRKRYIAWHNALLKDSSGNITGTLSSGQDITERKRAEAELREKVDELNRFNRLMVGRELKMVELKEEVNALLQKAGHKAKYTIADKQ